MVGWSESNGEHQSGQGKEEVTQESNMISPNDRVPVKPLPAEVPLSINCLFPDEIPPGWLDKLKDAAKPNWWITSGLPLVLAVMGILGSLLIAIYGNGSARKLDRLRSELQLQAAHKDNRIHAYEKLADSLIDLRTKLQGLGNFIEMSSRPPLTQAEKDEIDAQVKVLGKAELAVTDARNNQNLVKTKMISVVDNCLISVSRILRSGQDLMKALPDIRSATNKIDDLVERIQDETAKDRGEASEIQNMH